MDKLLLLGVDINDGCMGLSSVGSIIYQVLRLFWILIPIALILYGTIDLGKAVIASDEKEVKSAQSRLIKRFIYAVVVFLVPLLVSVVMSLVVRSVDDTEGNSWAKCYNAIKG